MVGIPVIYLTLPHAPSGACTSRPVTRRWSSPLNAAVVRSPTAAAVPVQPVAAAASASGPAVGSNHDKINRVG